MTRYWRRYSAPCSCINETLCEMICGDQRKTSLRRVVSKVCFPRIVVVCLWNSLVMSSRCERLLINNGRLIGWLESGEFNKFSRNSRSDYSRWMIFKAVFIPRNILSQTVYQFFRCFLTFLPKQPIQIPVPVTLPQLCTKHPGWDHMRGFWMEPTKETLTPVHMEFLRVCLKVKVYHIAAHFLDHSAIYDIAVSTGSGNSTSALCFF